MSDQIRELLDFDPLAAAERFTGESYKTDDLTSRLGLGLHLRHVQEKEAALRQRSDSFYSMSFEPAMNLFADLGFATVYTERFAGHSAEETYAILWHPDGLLATCESYTWNADEEAGRNTAKVYYNYRHRSGGYPSGLTSSGHMAGEVWVGDHDAREAIRYNLNAMRAAGRFLPVWVERPWLWLLNYADVKVEGYDHEALTERRIAALPEHVRRAITPPTPAEEVAS
jgi:hypothetical protein